jgi:phospholipid/cholesterol/gamma-HCH transport system permease protein
MGAVLALLASLGRQVIRFAEFFGHTTRLALAATADIVSGAVPVRLAIDQIAFVGYNSLPIVAVTMLFSGMVFAYHTAERAAMAGAGNLVGWVVAETMCRELGPVMVAIVVAARAGSAMTAQIGTMKVTEQLDALRAMAVSPVVYLVAPRLAACVLMVPGLAFLGDLVGVMGGYIMAVATPRINPVTYLQGIPGHLAGWTIIAGVIKALVFGIIIAIVACHEGLNCKQASEDVGNATTRSVVYCIMLIYAANLLLTRWLYPLR